MNKATGRTRGSRDQLPGSVHVYSQFLRGSSVCMCAHIRTKGVRVPATEAGLQGSGSHMPRYQNLGRLGDLGARYQNRLPKASYCRNSYCSFVCLYIRILHWWPLPQVAKGEQDATTGGVWLLECCFFPACVDLCSQPYV